MVTNNSTSKISRFHDTIFFILALGLFFYSSSRACLLSLTCDEASTYFSHLPNSIWSCFYSEFCWFDANNHLLNTFLMQISTSVFGVSEWTLRLPNLIGHIIYLIFSILLIRKNSKSLFLGIVGFCLLNLNPFLLEFFSLARGYGLGVGWMMMSIYFLFCWIGSKEFTLGIYCYVGAFFAVLSNFIFLNYWACLTAVLIFFILEKQIYEKNENRINSLFKSFGLPIFSSLGLFFLVKNPIQFLKSKGEFAFGTEKLSDSFVELVRVSLMSQGYFNPNTTAIFVFISLVLSGTSILFAIFYFLKQRDKLFSRIHLAGVSLMVLMILAMVVQFYLIDIKYLMGRKSIMLLPFFGLSTYLLLESIYRNKGKYKNWAVGLALLISVFSFNHIYRTFDLKETTEWSYDAYTKDMIHYLDGNLKENQEIELGVFWIYGPSSEFYQQYLSIKKIKKVNRLREEDFNEIETAELIYIRKDQMDIVRNKYILEKEFGSAGVLLKKKK